MSKFSNSYLTAKVEVVEAIRAILHAKGITTTTGEIHSGVVDVIPDTEENIDHVEIHKLLKTLLPLIKNAVIYLQYEGDVFKFEVNHHTQGIKVYRSKWEQMDF